jgi:hypothetical protein
MAWHELKTGDPRDMDESQRRHLLEYLSQELRDEASLNPRPGSTIGRLLSLHLENLPEWRWRWIDDLTDARIEVKESSVEVLGYAIWGNNGTADQWTDPLRAVFTRDWQGRIIGYELQFCDAERANQPYSGHRKHQPTADINWSYSFVWQARSTA